MHYKNEKPKQTISLIRILITNHSDESSLFEMEVNGKCGGQLEVSCLQSPGRENPWQKIGLCTHLGNQKTGLCTRTGNHFYSALPSDAIPAFSGLCTLTP